MPIPKTLSTDPYAILNPDDRWRPGAAADKIFDDNLMPPLVDKIRAEVQQWRADNYPNISETSRALLQWWFCRSPDDVQYRIRYYFAQREAVESVIYLYEAKQVHDKYDLLRFSGGGVLPEMMTEEWRRFVIKMATGSGKTKVMSLLILWSYFHKTYEDNSQLSRNILLIAPNIIVLDRLYRDFVNMNIFRQDGALPDNDYAGRKWQDDFKMRLHKQDEVRGKKASGNLYLTNIHRVYADDYQPPTADDEDSRNYFMGERAAANITDSHTDLSKIIRETDELLIMNDEAHHIHDEKMAWANSIKDLHHSLIQRGGALSLQLDFTATPKHNKGGIFVQTISDYPLVEAIHQNIVKRPVVPDEASETKLKERQDPNYPERFADYIELGVKEWRKARDQHKKAEKKAVLFVMTDDTKTCDEIAEYLQQKYADLKGKVLVIHTQNNGEISEKASGKKEKELQQLRKDAAEIDNSDNIYCAVVSVLVLREGWDVKNVTTIVGLRAYSAKSQILPEQTLGRGLRLMYGNNCGEKVSVIGTPAFAEFVKEIEREGVKLEKVEMNDRSPGQAPLIVAIERDNPNKDMNVLEIEIPQLSRRFVTDFSRALNLTAADIVVQPVQYQQYGKVKSREIVFCDVLEKTTSHTTKLGDGLVQDYSNVIAYFVYRLFDKSKLFSRYDYFYELVESFVRDHLFGKTVPLDSEDTLRNLAETHVMKTLLDAMSAAVHDIVREEIGVVNISGVLKISDMRTFAADSKQQFYAPTKSAQNYIIAANNKLELEFAKFLDTAADVVAFVKNYMAVGFCVEYVKTDGVIGRYFPDFLIKDNNNKIWIVETKGRQDENDLRKHARLLQWQKDISRHNNAPTIGCLWVGESAFKQYRPANFAELAKMFPLSPTDAATI